MEKNFIDKYDNSPINDENTIFLSNLGPSTEKQIQNFLETYIERYYNASRNRIWGEWKINHVTNKFGEPQGIAYVYFANPKMYHIFLGNNPDGSKRSAKIPNPHFDEIPINEENILQDFDLNTPAFIDVPYENPVKKPYIILNCKQVEKYGRNMYIEPKIDPCILRSGKANLPKNILVCQKAPNNINENYIKSIFEFYIKNRDDIESGYPKVNIESKGNFSTIEIVYHPDSIDGIFALIMTRKIRINIKNKNITLLFGHKNFSS